MLARFLDALGEEHIISSSPGLITPLEPQQAALHANCLIAAEI
jgi:hypothetical protein